MTPIRTTLATLGLAAAMLTASAGTAFAGDGDAYAASAGAGAGTATGGTAVLVDVPISKAFRAAPQGGAQNVTVAYSCSLAAAGAKRTQVGSCIVRTDRTSVEVSTDMIFQGDFATETGTITLPGSRASVCTSGFARDLFDVLIPSNGACSAVVLAV